ncbi:uncharacterized protein LOC144425075 [Styela clava]
MSYFVIQDVTPCGIYKCHDKALCNVQESCQCPDGVFGDGITWCTDYNECSDKTTESFGVNGVSRANIETNHTECGSSCYATYNGSEIQVFASNCDGNATCYNTFGGFNCTCKEGFSGNGITCTYIDLCKNVSCPKFSTCYANTTSYNCTCDEGYAGTECLKITPCYPSEPCKFDEECIIDGNSHICKCHTGYEKTSSGCQNIDECNVGNISCVVNSTCHDTNGSYECVCGNGQEMMDGFCKGFKVFSI